MNDSLIVQRPQFDDSKLRPGTAINFKRKYESNSKNAIIFDVKHDKLQIVYYDKENEYRDDVLDLNDLLTDALSIDILRRTEDISKEPLF